MKHLGAVVESLDELTGRRVLVDMTRLSWRGRLLGRYEFVGTVTSIGDVVSITKAGDDEPFTLPAEPRAFLPARHRLKGSGEIDADPDFTTVWTTRRPPPWHGLSRVFRSAQARRDRTVERA